jgi:hypothetical protein
MWVKISGLNHLKEIDKAIKGKPGKLQGIMGFGGNAFIFIDEVLYKISHIPYDLNSFGVVIK